ncbi:MAG: hypothetical protein BGP24_02230 [Lysobacterales bacterium 69-70]|nr:hypothetical protein [Xanthomonadaceae bacterium]ODU31860.1 MAG: hypothetical protein ABS97_16500 [Xanthomonadaceae bacterium SCN 69-320]ODV18878.1 MAG: hypothetical protein ABT27_12810 [Xanthomonadaceae bacterium SCN 69-25]OJZ01585.1 MAG: hypothetical protein BGP24_02230 [Xanthomonadales bacterium 69-70]
MNKNAFAIALGLLAAAGAGSAAAQSCASPSTIPLVGGNTHTANGDTCASSNQLGTLCGAFSSPENDVIYRFNIDNTRTATSITLSTTTATWNPAMLYLSGSCGGGVSCADVADSNNAGASETMMAPTANGTYYLVVTSSPGSGGCGAFTLNAFGRLPVALQNFSID